MKKGFFKFSLIYFFVVLILVLILFAVSKGRKNEEYVECLSLIQVSPQTPCQMMGYVIITENDKIIVVDGGTEGDADNLAKYINEHGKKVDYWFITHLHNDHAGALYKIVNTTDIEIDNIYVSANDKNWYIENEPKRAKFSTDFIDMLSESRIKDKVREPYLNEKIYFDNIEMEILGIRNPEILTNCGNNQSMVVKFSYHDKSILFLGDTGVESGAKLLENQREKLKSNIVQMAHHGQAGADFELYKAIDPETCLFPTSDWIWDNYDGTLKIDETKAWIKQLNVNNIYVAKDGDQVIKLK